MSEPHFHVYVIRLDGRVWNIRAFREENPRRDLQKPCVYVGATGLTPEQRFERHKQGIQSNSYVRRFGVELMPRLYARYNPFSTWGSAHAMEILLARRLRERGYGVHQN